MKYQKLNSLLQITPNFVLDKNPESESKETKIITTIVENDGLNYLMYVEPFIKTYFIKELISFIKYPITYLDFDLLYSGYTVEGFISIPKNLTLFQPTKNNWYETFKTLLLKISVNKSVIILDSLNGFFTLLNEKKDVGRLVSASLMLLQSIASMSNSKIIVTSKVSRKDNELWVLSPTGRHIVESKNTTKFYLKKENSFLILDAFSKTRPHESHKIRITSELIPEK